MANHHIGDTIAIITSVATTAATIATGFIAWAVFRFQRSASQPVLMTYVNWVSDANSGPTLMASVNIINRADAPLLVQGYSIDEPAGAWIGENESVVLYQRSASGPTVVRLNKELQPKGTLEAPFRDFSSGFSDRMWLRFAILCPNEWPGERVILNFQLSEPGRAERILKITKQLQVGPPPKPKPPPIPAPLQIPY